MGLFVAQTLRSPRFRWRAPAFLADFSATFTSRLASKFVTAIVVAMIARRLGPQTFGAYVAITTYLGIATSVVDFGLAPYVTRAISQRVPGCRPLWIAAGIRVSMGIVLAVVGVSAVFASGLSPIYFAPVLCLAAAMFLDLCTDILLAALRGHGQFHAIARTTVVRGLATFLTGSGVILWAPSLTSLTAATLVSSFAGLLYTAHQSRQFLTSWPVWSPLFSGNWLRVGWSALGSALAPTWGFGVSAILCSIYMRISPALLARCSAAQVGVYGAAYKIVEAGLFAPSIVCSIFLPYLSSARAASREEFDRMVDAAMRLMVIPAFLTANLMIAFSDSIINLIYGPQFAPAGQVLEILAILFLVTSITGGVQSAVLMSLGEMKYLSFLMGGAVLVSFPLNFVLTEKWGAIGAALGYCACEILVLIANFVILERRGQRARIKLTVVCVGLTIAGAFAHQLPSPFPALVPITYFAGFGWKCLQEIRQSVVILSRGRRLMAQPQTT